MCAFEIELHGGFGALAFFGLGLASRILLIMWTMFQDMKNTEYSRPLLKLLCYGSQLAENDDRDVQLHT